MLTLCRVRLLIALLLGGGVFFSVPQVQAIPADQIRQLVKEAEVYEKTLQWEKARQVYEDLLGQKDPGLRIRERYQHALRRCWQARRHQDVSYTKEVLSVDYGQALQICNIVHNTLLDGAYNKKKIDSAKLFRKSLEELDEALGDAKFVQQHVPASRQANVPAFRAMLRKKMASPGGLTRDKALARISDVALEAEFELGLDPTVAVMELACGACYAVDEYTVYLTPNQLRELAQNLNQTDAIGVGLTLVVQENRIVVRNVVMDSAASQFVIPGDEIISVNKQPVLNFNVNQVADFLRGPAGTMVEIEIQSPTDDMPRTIQLTRQAALASVSFYQLPGTPYSHLKITSFTDATLRDIDQALKQPGMKGLIIDLRQNGGGIVDSAIATARKFLATGIIASRVHQDSAQNHVYHAKNPDALTVPLIVLVDNDTASAAEVLAGALKENGRATLIGQTTFGKGCTQCVLRIADAPGGVPTGGMRLTVARFFSPKGQPYSGRGVIPHIFIDERIAASQSTAISDPYLDRAIDELNRMLTTPK